MTRTTLIAQSLALDKRSLVQFDGHGLYRCHQIAESFGYVNEDLPYPVVTLNCLDDFALHHGKVAPVFSAALAKKNLR